MPAYSTKQTMSPVIPPVLHRALAALILLGLLAGPAAAADCQVSPARAIVDRILDLRPADAERLVDAWAAQRPDDPMVDFYRALTVLGEAYVDEYAPREPYWQRALRHLKRAISRAGGDREEAALGPRQRLVVGMAESFRGLILLARGNKLQAYQAAWRGRNMLEDLVGSHPELADAYVVLGIYEYFTGSAPPAERRKLRLAGMDGDAALGVSYLEQAIEQAPVMAPEAARILLMEVKRDETESCRYVPLARDMARRYPHNRPLQLLARVVALECRVAREEGLPVDEPLPLAIHDGCGGGLIMTRQP